jgi:uncharacterized membrane protein (UPF0127 family)
MRTWLTVGIIIVALGVTVYQIGKHAPIYKAATDSTTVTIDGKTFDVELAVSQAAQEKGLSGRTSLASSAGMLFPFNPPQQPSFWMIDMNFPLDMVWINNGKIVHITRDAPKPAKGTPNDQLPLYEASTNINYVLEINAGQAKEFKNGDSVKINTTQNL